MTVSKTEELDKAKQTIKELELQCTLYMGKILALEAWSEELQDLKQTKATKDTIAKIEEILAFEDQVLIEALNTRHSAR